MINTGLPRYITLRLWGERTGKEEGREGGGRKLRRWRLWSSQDDALASWIGGKRGCAAVSVKFSRPTLNGPFATPCPSSSAGDSLGLHRPRFPRQRRFKKRNGLKRIRHSTFERRTLIGVSPTFSPSSNKGLDSFRRRRKIQLFNRTSSQLSFSFFLSFPFFFINPIRATAKRRIENFSVFRCKRRGKWNEETTRIGV